MPSSGQSYINAALLTKIRSMLKLMGGKSRRSPGLQTHLAEGGTPQ